MILIELISIVKKNKEYRADLIKKVYYKFITLIFERKYIVSIIIISIHEK